MNKISPLSILLSAILMLSIISNGQCQNKNWIAPLSSTKIANPLKGNAASAIEGKKLYLKLCSVCHGDKGKGDGIAGMAINPKPTNFTSDQVSTQTDGALFWKISEGRAPMAGYRVTLTEAQRWQLVNYIRTLKK